MIKLQCQAVDGHKKPCGATGAEGFQAGDSAMPGRGRDHAIRKNTCHA